MLNSGHRHGDGSNRNGDFSHVLTCMHAIAKMAKCSGAHIERARASHGFIVS